MRFLLILAAAAGVYASIWILGKHGLAPDSQDFWVCLAPPFIAGAFIALAPTINTKASSLLDIPEDEIEN